MTWLMSNKLGLCVKPNSGLDLNNEKKQIFNSWFQLNDNIKLDLVKT